jgi:hypothetical protein
MTDAQKKALIKKLGAESNKAFDARYSGDNRKWFVGKIIDYLLAQGVQDTDIEQQTNDIIFDSDVAFKARIKKGFPSGSLATIWKFYDQLKSRTQIIYGMIAMHPEFRDAANLDYFEFILERRFRSIQRMNFFVNPSHVRNVFAYPDPDAKPPEKMKVNGHADTLWNGVQSGSLPFILTNSGKSNPKNAVEKLFMRNTGTNRNLFACDPVATTLHMDALLVAKTPDKLLKALANIDDHYLKIDNPLGHFANNPDGQRLVAITSAPVTAGNNVEIPLGRVGMVLAFSKDALTAAILTTNAFISVQNIFFMIVHGNEHESFLINGVNPVTKKIKVTSLTMNYASGAKVYVRRDTSTFFGTLLKTLPFHFITDGRPDHALFEQLTVKAKDLQVGDHVYMLNHPLYKIFRPTGFWGGEHSFISEIGTRDSAASMFRTTLEVEGHGLSNTLLGMGNEMLEYVNTDVSRLQAVTKIHLNNLKTNNRNSTANVKVIERSESHNNTQITMNVFEYDVPYTYTQIKKGKRTAKTITGGFVIKEVKGASEEFQTFNLNDKDSTVLPKFPQPDVFFRVVFIGNNFSTEQFIPSSWAVLYINAQTAAFEVDSLFEKNQTPKFLTFENLVKSKPFFATDDNGDAFVTRPRVDFSAAHQTFLKNNGAI